VALAATDRKDYAGAAASLRRAVAADPAAFESAVASDRTLSQRVNAAMNVYQNPPRKAVGDADAKFMVAAFEQRQGRPGGRPGGRAVGDRGR